ncbi:hypothetical protein TNIN_353621 [Trichonephila inaurata madagascariensis]|uniref:Uncharacterized protein n=1 Tax=Trichonephila inaurata madagascariensis TaxID=2747483 RepID=A0A8X7C8R6_9ARAC|nr:hypothetical protein TNIN_353621 [Trichonephila inaurata madagascariensis]
MPDHPSDAKFINHNLVSFSLYREQCLDGRRERSKLEKSEVHSRATGRVLADAESWQRHPAAAARRWVFVTVFPSRHYTAVRSRLGARGTMTDKRRVLSLK